ncbi:hypothetical protein M9H77_03069 [Catharanthus roseus]|uniref:Uncharacterized protein n=1 Tax=Catharanthus roseus TaxID=4058 RepID=A0ACC0CA93_CATRO|nr:hypothetical protein M9H77_03069 [Catharanthus roseus]
MSSIPFEGDKRDEMKEDCCDIISPLNSLSSEENSIPICGLLNYNLWNRPNHGMKVKGEGIGKELSINYEDTSISLSSNLFLLCHEFSFKELKSNYRIEESIVAMNRMSPSFKELKLGQMTRSKRKKVQLQEDNDVIACIIEALKNKEGEFEGHGKHSKLFTKYSIDKEQ